MSESFGGSEKFKPLPLRRSFWKEIPPLLKRGVVVVPEDAAEREDARNAAQAVIIDSIEKELMSTFQRPELPGKDEFYSEFFTAYDSAVTEQETVIWGNIGKRVEEKTKKHQAGPLDEESAAYLTLRRLGEEEAPQSRELYLTLAPIGRAYEERLREKYGEHYSPSLLYDGFRKHMPHFMLRFISMDSVISHLVALNSPTKETRAKDNTEPLISSHTKFDPRVIQLDDHDSLRFAPKFIDLIHSYAREKGITEDMHGRTEDRGCPVLYSSERDAIIKFAIEELIAQHQKAFPENTFPG
jgi:hypothetical protein